MEQKTKITLKNEYGVYSIEVKKEDMNIDEMFSDLIVPVLVASGYSQETVDRYLGEE